MSESELTEFVNFPNNGNHHCFHSGNSKILKILIQTGILYFSFSRFLVFSFSRSHAPAWECLLSRSCDNFGEFNSFRKAIKKIFSTIFKNMPLERLGRHSHVRTWERV
jgi:hypothetical protein